MRLRQVVAVVDSSDAGSHAAWRAARLAWSQGARLRLLALLDVPDRHPAARHGPSAPPVQARVALCRLADAIDASMGVRAEVVVGLEGDGDAALRRHLHGASVVVLPGAAALPHRAGWWRGGLAERVLRETGAPVFLVRRPAGVAHRCAVVAAGPDIAGVAPLLSAARWFCRPEALLACHVLDPAISRHLHAADLAPLQVQSWLETAARRAERALGEQLAQAGLHAGQAQVVQGDALACLLRAQQRHGASLLVVGKPRRGHWADLLRPALGRRLAERTACDMLWLPWPEPSVHAARQRLGWLDAAAQ